MRVDFCFVLLDISYEICGFHLWCLSLEGDVCGDGGVGGSPASCAVALGAFHTWDHGVMKICIVVAPILFLIAAVGAGENAFEISAALVGLCFEVHGGVLLVCACVNPRALMGVRTGVGGGYLVVCGTQLLVEVKLVRVFRHSPSD